MKQKLFELTHFDEYREGNRLEVKKANGGLPNSLWETYSSFSNCNGGVIILGVKEREDGSWCTTHLQNRNKLLKDFWDTINNRQKVSVNLLNEENVETYEIGGDVIIVIYVAKADRAYKPVYINNELFGGTFRRNHEGDYHCSEAEVRGMLRDQAARGMDNKILHNMDLDIFYPETVKSFRSRHAAVNPDHVWHKLDDNAYLERIGAASISDIDGKLHPTVAGLLMFGEEYKIRYEFPDYFLDYREMLDPSIRWTDRLESSSGEWSGNIMDFFFQMERKLLRDIKKPFKLDGITRIDETPVHKAIREALANCFANADFNFSRGIVILKDQDFIIIENPGCIITGKAQMLKGGISEPRNSTIMKMFNLIHVGERAGSGVPNIFSIWNDEGWIPPEVEELYQPDRTILRLSFVSKTVDAEQNSAIGTQKSAIESDVEPKTTQAQDETTQALDVRKEDVRKEDVRKEDVRKEDVRKEDVRKESALDVNIINLLKEQPDILLSNISEQLGVSYKTIQRAIAYMKSNGRIERVGGRKNGHWIVRD